MSGRVESASDSRELSVVRTDVNDRANWQPSEPEVGRNPVDVEAETSQSGVNEVADALMVPRL